MQPEKLGPFRIGRVLGRGGMGAVYEGVHEVTGETAAVKVLLSMLEEDEEIRLRFEAEIDTLKRLRHPNIVRLYGFGEEQGLLYYVMELVDGPSLQQEMKRQRLFQWFEVAKIGLEMCYALKHAHDRGITHRDIKPANILLERQGSIKLSDYGIAHFFGGQRLTEINSVVGTLEYMSPEQSLANPVGPRSDLYSLGAVLYALLVGKPPFTARNLAEIIRKHKHNTIDSINLARLDVPDEMSAIVLDLLHILPEERPGNAYLVAKRFQSLLQALVGPPDKIPVKPMTGETPTMPSSAAVRVPAYGSDPEIIGRPRGMVIENGIIDLGGIVQDGESRPEPLPETRMMVDEKNETSDDSPEPSASLAASFGNPGTDLAPTQIQGEENMGGTDDEWSLEQAELIRQDYRRLNIPMPDTAAREADGKESVESVSPESETGTVSTSPDHEQAKRKTLESQPATSVYGMQSGPEIIHGEIVVEGDSTGFRRNKDEPIPKISVFDVRELQRDRAEPVSQNDERSDDTLTVDGLESPRNVGRDVPSDVAPELYGLSPPEEHDRAGAAATPQPASASTSRFVTVGDEELDDYEATESHGRPIVSIQTILASVCLILIGVIVWYSLQPVSPDVLFEKIKATIGETDENGEWSPQSLRHAKSDIRFFLDHYADHPKSDVIRDYEEELNIADLERRLERRQQTAQTSAERAYLDAIATLKTDPEKTVIKLKALIDLFSSDAPLLHEQEESHTPHPVARQRRSSPVEQCVELAKRRLRALEKDLATINAEQCDWLQNRLREARQLESHHPERAAAIRRGIVELYQDRPWAQGIVDQAKDALK